MSKRRCSNCGTYVDKEALFKTLPLGAVCSAECMNELRAGSKAKPRKVSSKASVARSSSAIPPAVRERVLKRDGWRCRFCGETFLLHVHHILYRSQGGPDEESNLITLCNEHHALVHSDKRRYMPLCRAYIWLRYVKSLSWFIPQIERSVERLGWSPDRRSSGGGE